MESKYKADVADARGMSAPRPQLNHRTDSLRASCIAQHHINRSHLRFKDFSSQMNLFQYDHDSFKSSRTLIVTSGMWDNIEDTLEQLTLADCSAQYKS